MSEATQRWEIGSARVTSVVEAQTDGIPPAFFFPTADESLVLRHPWLAPDFADHQGRLGLRVQAFVIEAGGRTVVVDPCVGNGRDRSLPFWNQQDWPFMERFRGAGFDPEDVDLVIHTHLHVDHVGWDTYRDDGRWVPTFTRARHLYVGTEVESQAADTSDDAAAVRGDAIEPIFAAGLAETIEADADLGGGLRLTPTAGHTRGHASLWLDGGGERLALITGDTLHHPIQCRELEVSFVSDEDSAVARATRRRLLAEAADAGALVFGTHFPTSPAGTLTTAGAGTAAKDEDGDGWRFVPVGGR
jgi:glyoxylase-like metal-dependent hydrolase (beta-lactamase superfamily II)